MRNIMVLMLLLALCIPAMAQSENKTMMLPDMVGKLDQQAVFRGGEIHRLVILPHFRPGKINFKIAVGEIAVLRYLFRGTRPAEHGAHPGHQLGCREWLYHVIICANVQTAHAVLFFTAGSENDDRHI